MRFEGKDLWEPQYWHGPDSDVAVPGPARRLAPVKRLLRDVLREMAALPLPAKLLIALALIANFLVITQWERLPFAAASASRAPVVQAPAVERRDFNFEDMSAVEAPDAAAAQKAQLRRMATITIEDPKVESDGSIRNDGQTLFLYGIKRFDSKAVCTRASGDRWACGLQAYATLRNELAHKTIVCEPKKILERALAATCRLNGLDVALILIRKGLVEVADDADVPDLLQVQAAARTARLGVWDR
jgi:endonuclease YncB( thermonuclease family)